MNCRTGSEAAWLSSVLPYAAEPAVSKHIAAFLRLHREACREALKGEGVVPDALLLNGGVFRSRPITQRTVELINSWADKPPVLLENKHPELSVALGAVSYAIARREKKLKIGGGAARSYFLLVDTEKAVQQGVCILPRGSEEGDEVILKERQICLASGAARALPSGLDDRRYAVQARRSDRRYRSVPFTAAFGRGIRA